MNGNEVNSGSFLGEAAGSESGSFIAI